MKNKFILGALAGMSALTLAVPALSQLANAETAATTDATASANAPAKDPNGGWNRPAPTQADVQTMIQHDQDFLANVDALVSVAKSATQTHLTALQSAADITDDTEREAAVKKANDDRRTAIETAVQANAGLKSAMMGFGPGHGHGPMGEGFGHGPEELAAKLGMTADELKAAIQSGKTIEQIAQEKGVTLPARPQFGGRGHGHGMFMMPGMQGGASTDGATSLGTPGSTSSDHPGQVIDADGDEWVPASPAANQ